MNSLSSLVSSLLSYASLQVIKEGKCPRCYCWIKRVEIKYILDHATALQKKAFPVLENFSGEELDKFIDFQVSTDNLLELSGGGQNVRKRFDDPPYTDLHIDIRVLEGEKKKRFEELAASFRSSMRFIS